MGCENWDPRIWNTRQPSASPSITIFHEHTRASVGFKWYWPVFLYTYSQGISGQDLILLTAVCASPCCGISIDIYRFEHDRS